MKKWLYRGVSLLLIVAFVICMNFLGTLLMPARADMGSKWESYLQEPEDSIDVLFLGSSMVYCDVVPAQICLESGITSYAVTGPELTIPITYYYLREALRTQSPKAVFVEMNGMFFDEYTEYTSVTVGYMPWSVNRLAATVLCAEPEKRFELLYPLHRYHSTFDIASIRAHLQPEADINAGYTPLDYAEPQGETTEREHYTADSETYLNNLEYIGKIRDLCVEEGIALYLYAAPSKGIVPAKVMETLVSDLASMGLELIDFNSSLPSMNINDETDWFDFLHFNHSGALKFSSFLAEFLTEQGIAPSAAAQSELWQMRLSTVENLV